jgi:hypothetical protein
MSNYYSATFEDMETITIQSWLCEAQWCLPSTNGKVREILKEGISAAAGELLIRYRQEIKNLA